jgi:hypothetical protein
VAKDSGWRILSSTMLRAIAYDEGDRTLLVRFATGSVYRYVEVPREIYENLIDPPDGSTGRYFNEVVRDGFDYEEL